MGSIVTLGMASYIVSEYEQGYGFYHVAIPVRVYQLIGHKIDASLEHLEDNFEIIVNRLGADRTLGGKVANSEVSDNASQSTWTTGSGQMFSVIDFVVTVTPFSNTGE